MINSRSSIKKGCDIHSHPFDKILRKTLNFINENRDYGFRQFFIRRFTRFLSEIIKQNPFGYTPKRIRIKILFPQKSIQWGIFSTRCEYKPLEKVFLIRQYLLNLILFQGINNILQILDAIFSPPLDRAITFVYALSNKQIYKWTKSFLLLLNTHFPFKGQSNN